MTGASLTALPGFARHLRRIQPRSRPQAGSGVPEYEINRPHHAQGGPNIVQLEGLLEVEHGKGHEDRQGDHLLDDLELTDIERGQINSDLVSVLIDQLQRWNAADAGCVGT